MQGNSMKIDYAAREPGEEVVISGIAGRFPESKNVIELKNNLLSKKDMITDNSSRWKIDNPEVPREGGKVHGLSKFDSIFFGVHYKQAEAMDPMCRMLLEHSYEAIIDAGINPRQLRGTITGVVIASIFNDSNKVLLYDNPSPDGFGITGSSKALLANRISYFLGLHGPSLNVDTACSSSITALDQAYRMIRTGICDTVIVGGCNVCLQPSVSQQFTRLGVLSPDCRCKTFDERADGYVRSDAVSVIVVQKAANAKRIYAQIVHTYTNCDGYKEQGITFPSSEGQKMLLKSCYDECKVSPSAVSFVEAHGTGTKVGDPVEITAIGSVFCQGRSTPLPVGSVKSNMGHAESAAGLCSVAKVIIAMETGIIPANLHFKSPLKGIKYFEEGKIQVITENTPWEGGYVGINSFGFGGSNAHALLKSHTKEKVNNGAPYDDLPRLIIASGRTEEAMETLLSYVESIPVDVEYIRLLHEVYSEDITGHLFRGYTIVGSKISEKPPRAIQEYRGLQRPICYVVSGMGSQWAGMGDAMMRFPVFAKAIQKCDAALKPYGVDLIDIVTNKDEKIFDNILNSFIGIVAIQIGLVDMLTAVGIKPDIIIGHSTGELGCSYADGCCTAEQVILLAYFRGLASITTKTIPGSMAAVGLGYEDVKQMCPSDIVVACHNGPDSSTISGPAESMKEFVAKLQANNIFAKEVPCGNIAYHSRYVAEVGDKLLVYLKQVIRDPKPRTSRWLSTSVPRNQWSSPAARYASAEYYTNNLHNYVLFAETATMIPPNAIAIEIAPHGLMQAILKSSLNPNAINVPLLQCGHEDNAEYFLQALGNLYNVGLQPQVANLYPHVEFPVGRGTPMISPYIKWEHSQDWFVPMNVDAVTSAERTVEITLKDEKYEYMMHHVVDGRILVPATGYLTLVWETFGLLKGKRYDEVSVVLEDIKFERATMITANSSVRLTIMIHRGSGKFEISERSTTVVSGLIREMNDPSREKIPPKFLTAIDDDEALNEEDIYKELKLRGYDYTGLFRALRGATIKGRKGRIAWMNNWAAFIDNMLQITLLSMDSRALYVPTAIRKLVIDVGVHNDKIQSSSGNENEISVQVYDKHETIISGGIQISGMRINPVQRRKPTADAVLEKYKFVANRDKVQTSLEEMVILSTHLALESNTIINPKIMELVDLNESVSDDELLTPMFAKVLANLPLVCPNIILAANDSVHEKASLSEDIVVIQPNELPDDGSIFMAAAYNVLLDTNRDTLKRLLLATTDYGFILTRETIVNDDTYSYLESCGLNVVLEKNFNNEVLLLLKKQEELPSKTEVVFLNSHEFTWLQQVKEALNRQENRTSNESLRLILVAEGDLEDGALGFIKCLSKEPDGEIAKAVIIQDRSAPKFSLDDPFYAKQLDIGLVINVLRPGKVWGTYRHVPLPPLRPVPVTHGFANLRTMGDLSSTQWIEGPIRLDGKPENSNVVKVVYSALNFRDVMFATRKLTTEDNGNDRRAHESGIGFEFSGLDSNNRPVMGYAEGRAISNLVTCHKFSTWPVPEGWSLEDAATVPVAYLTVFYAFSHYGKLQKGEKVLIHSGSGAVGQAAIGIAIAEGCEVFTTVGTAEKREFIKTTFPSIDDDHIGNSRDTSFEQMVMEGTNGEGVDLVLNSLSEDKLLASARCLRYRGRFLEIGKFDIEADNPLGMKIFSKEISFHGVMLDRIMFDGEHKLREELHHMFSAYLKSKAVRPLVRRCFEKHQVEDALRYMAAGKHIGKVLIKIRSEEEPLNAPVLAYPRFNAAQDKCYVIVGGLGGFGLELIDWLVARGANNVVIVSRNDIRTGYQRMRMETWRSYGVKVLLICGVDVSNTNDCDFVLRTAEKQAPVDGIFNLAVVLKDAFLVKQTAHTYEEVMKPKARITKKLDQLSRKICPKLRHFVVFSSVSSGRGNTGQTNYGMGNAVSERICERRVEDGLPGMAIQWGMVGEVGLAITLRDDKQELDIAGTGPQSVSSCLEALDKFLSQNEPIVASMVVAGKNRPSTSEAGNVLEAITSIMKINDLKTVNPTTSLAELGMDSLMVTEIKQVLERDFGLFLTAKDIRALNLSKLAEMSAKEVKNPDINAKQTRMHVPMDFLNESLLSTEHCAELPVNCGAEMNEVFLIPGMEGSPLIFSKIASSLKRPATCLQLGIHDTDESVEEMAERLLPHVLERSNGRKDFEIVGYSYGTMIAIELARRLEARGLVGHLIFVDGTPDYIKAMRVAYLPLTSENEMQNNFLCSILNSADPVTIGKFQLELSYCSTWSEKLDKLLEYTPADNDEIYTPENRKAIYSFIFKRQCSIDKYDPVSLPPIEASITLLKAKFPVTRLADESYGVSKLTTGKVTVHTIEGDHISIINNSKTVAVINGEPLDEK